jgi:hypothetical protein
MKTLSEVRVILQRLQPGERAVELDYPDNLGKRTKLGGEPDWIQSPESTLCSCGAELTFVAQIDSIDDHGASGIPYNQQEYMFDDVGMIYVFFCSECGEATSFVQGY